MNKSMITRWIMMILILLSSIINAHAAVPKWQIIPNESSITFTGVQNNAPASGSFKKFSGEISFDPNQLNASTVTIIIDMNSLSMSYSDFTVTLMSADWFNVKLFPQAIFKANEFAKIANNQYQAKGTLTIRDKTEPLTLTFTAEELSKTKGHVKGTTTVKRTVFGIGQGEWADTSAVKDDVQVNFDITAVRK